ncbi:MAG: hypothetical protein IKP31_01745 [Lachnospiraceae bacterium]|nr:hypothetical protein [Lachnospiraceae bacterium]
MKHIKFRSVLVLMLITSIAITGCNGNNNEDPAAQDNAETAEPANAPEPISVSGTVDKGRDINFIRTPYDEASNDQFSSEITPTPAFSAPSSDDVDSTESAPQFFDVEDPLEPVMGYCDNDMCDALIKELNAQRTNFGTGTLTKNYSLCVAADVRAREYSMYPVYKERSDGRPFTSVSPQGYVKNEYFVVPARNSVVPVWDASKGMWFSKNQSYKEYTYTPATVMEGLMEIREARNILLSEDYKQVGASWFVTGSYFIAGFTLSY